MTPYLAIVHRYSKALLQYRAALFSGVITQIVWGMIQISILQGFYAQANSPVPLDLSQAMTFVWIGQALFLMLPWTVDPEIASQLRDGRIVHELMRPVDLYSLWFARSFGLRLLPLVLRALLISIVAIFCFNLTPPHSPWTFYAALINAFILSTAITTLATITLFWTLSAEGLHRLLQPLSLLLSGLLIPLPLFPNWTQLFLRLQPFRGVLDIPCGIYTGSLAPTWLLFQIGWSALLICVGYRLLNRSLRQITLQGG